MNIEGLCNHYRCNVQSPNLRSDDDHIVVCVRVRNVPPVSDIPHYAMQKNTRPLCHSQRICVSVIDNIVVMHDPKSIDDAYTVERDSIHVAHLLSDPLKCSLSGGTVSYCSKKTSLPIHSLIPFMLRSVNSPNSSTFRGTTNCYECDQCVVSMDETSVSTMPLLRADSLFRSPAFGTQAAVYHSTAVHAVKAALGGINSCVFAYGQADSGKTYTLFGDPTSLHHDPGLVERTFEDIFLTLDDLSSEHAKESATQDFKYKVLVSFMEIHRNEVYCLLSGKGPLRVRFTRNTDGTGDGANIDGLLQAEVSTTASANQFLKLGLRRRRVDKTSMNAFSSRSHAILQIRVIQCRTNHNTHETMEHSAKINLVDLAGSQRQRTANMHRRDLTDRIYINQSLTALSRVINDVACGSKFVNYRDSLLTMILKDSFGGNSKTFMIANISPIALNYEESCATLAFSNAVRHICNRFTVNCIIHKHLKTFVSNLLPGEEGQQGTVEKMEGLTAHQKGILNSHCDYTRTLSGFPTKKQTPALATNPCLLASTHRRERKGCEAFINFATSESMCAPLAILLIHKRLRVTGTADLDVGESNGIVRIIALDNDFLELNLAQLIQPEGLLGFSKQQKVMATTEQVMSSLAEKQLMVQKEVARAMEARITPLLERTLFESHNSESQRGSASSNDEDEISTVVGSVPNSHTGCFPPHNPLSTSFGCLSFKRDSQDHAERLYVHFIPPEEAECSQSIVDVRVNGKHLRKDYHELGHGDTIYVIFQDGAFCENTQDHLVFYCVDFNHYNGNIKSTSNALSERLDRNTESLTVSSRSYVEKIQLRCHDTTEVIKPTPENLNDIVTESFLEAELFPKNDRTTHTHRNSPSLQVPSDGPVRELSSLLRDSSQGIMCCVSSPSSRSPSSKVMYDVEHNMGHTPDSPKKSWHHQDSTVEENKTSSCVVNPNIVFNPSLERGLGALDDIQISGHCPSNNNSGNIRCNEAQGVTNILFSDDPRDLPLPEISQGERGTTRVSSSWDEEGLMVSSERSTVYQDAIFDEATVACDNSRPSSTTHVVAFSTDILQDKGLTIPPGLLISTHEQYPKVALDTFPKNRVSVLFSTIHNLENENRRLREENLRYEESLLKFSDSINSSQGTKTGAIADSEKELVVSECLDQFVNKQSRTIEELRKKTSQLEQLVSSEEGKIRFFLRYVEDAGLMDIDGDSHFIKLHHRIEELISESISKQGITLATASSAFPCDFDHNQLTALIYLSLRILFNRLKNVLYAVNRKSLEKMSLILDTVLQYRETPLSCFTLELREIVADVVGEPQRSGERWSLTAEDVYTRFVSSYRDRAVDILYSLLIWYDIWDLSSNIEHVCAMELIRNADRIVQIARQVRQGDLSMCQRMCTTLELPEITKQDVIADISYPVRSCKEGAKPSQKSASFVAKVRESDPHTELSEVLCGSASGQLTKARVNHKIKSSAAKATFPSRQPTCLGNTTSLSFASLQASRSGGSAAPSMELMLKKWDRLVAEKKDRVPVNAINICSSKNATLALPVRKNKLPVQVREGSSKGMRPNRGTLFVRNHSLMPLSSGVPFERYNTTIPSLGHVPAVPVKGLQR
ncbi:unnamed protein product [Phytomonas sp. Hart1]|nr:unnamed protein product [Phytomonas sp. Hart1]|eukprot:CCW70323.1 unnamed protein product [Phytomonas sp. isolate Hart1]